MQTTLERGSRDTHVGSGLISRKPFEVGQHDGLAFTGLERVESREHGLAVKSTLEHDIRSVLSPPSSPCQLVDRFNGFERRRLARPVSEPTSERVARNRHEPALCRGTARKRPRATPRIDERVLPDLISLRRVERPRVAVQPRPVTPRKRVKRSQLAATTRGEQVGIGRTQRLGIGHVVHPNKEYNGHVPTRPVTSGTRPR